MLMAVACGNSSSKISKEKMQEINAQSQFADTVKPASSIKFDFENYATDKLPDGWSQYYTGSVGTNWKVTNDNGNKALAQLYSSSGYYIPKSRKNRFLDQGRCRNLL